MMNNELRPYDKYKETNFDWLAEIPIGWELTKLSTKFFERRTKVSDKDYMPLSVTKKGIVPQLSTAAKSNDGDNRKLVKKGDFVINSRSDRKGSSGLSPLDGSVSLINIVLEPQNIKPEYAHYLLKSNRFIEEYYRNGRGIVADLWTTRFTEMKNIYIPIPSVEEQDQIVKYLDNKLKIINKFIKAKKKLIAVLKEQKQAIINQAVTKGLDLDVKMKSSGNEWLGDVPEHWECTKLKFLTNSPFQYGANETGQTYTENAYRYIRITDITNQGTLKDTGLLYLSSEIGKPFNLSEGDILLARSGATVGKSFLYKSEHGRAAYAGYLIRFTPNRNVVLPDFVYLFTLSGAYSVWLNQIFIQSTIQNVSADKYKNLVIPVPSIAEQELIIKYILNETSVFDSTIDRIESEIKLINEYKNSLVSNAVTGKIDIRNVVLEEIDEENIEDLDVEYEKEEDFIDEGGDE